MSEQNEIEILNQKIIELQAECNMHYSEKKLIYQNFMKILSVIGLADKETLQLSEKLKKDNEDSVIPDVLKALTKLMTLLGSASFSQAAKEKLVLMFMPLLQLQPLAAKYEAEFKNNIEKI